MPFASHNSVNSSFLADCKVLNSFLWEYGIFPLHWCCFQCWGEMTRPRFIASDNATVWLWAWRKMMLTSKENTSDTVMRWKPRCIGGCKHWALISSLLELNRWYIAGINVSISLMIMWRNRGFVC
jgi:hypothetical protein